MAGVGLVPLVDVDLAVAEARHAVDLGLVGVLARPNHLYGRNLGDPAYDPLYARAGRGRRRPRRARGPRACGARRSGPTASPSFTARHLLSHPLEQMAAMASLVLDGALDRHPDPAGGLPRVGDRLAAVLAAPARRAPGVGRAATPGRRRQAFAEQCVISTEADDDLVGGVAAAVGADHVLWASDFPHPDALFPDAATTFVREARGQGIGDDDLATILWDAPARLLPPRDDRFAADANLTVSRGAAMTSDARGRRHGLRHHGPVQRRRRRPARPVPGPGREAPKTLPVEATTYASFIEGLEETTYIVHRYDDVVAVMRDNVTFSSSAIRELMAPVMGDYVLVGMDEPEHKRLRAPGQRGLPPAQPPGLGALRRVGRQRLPRPGRASGGAPSWSGS